MGAVGDFLGDATSVLTLGASDALGLTSGPGEGFLFGKPGEPGQVIDTTVPEFRELRKPVGQSIVDLINKGGLPEATGPFTVQPTDAEKFFLNRIADIGGGPNEFQQQGRDLLSKTIQGDFLQNNPFLEGAINAATRPVIDRFNEVTLPGVISQFKNAGQTIRNDPNRVGSSAFLNQVRLADKDLINAVGDISSNLSFQNFNQERSRQAQAGLAAEEITSRELDNAVKSLQSLQLPRLIEQLGVDRGLEEFRRRTESLLQLLQLGGGIATGTTQNVAGTPATQGALGSLALAGATLFG